MRTRSLRAILPMIVAGLLVPALQRFTYLPTVAAASGETVTVSIVGTSDLHGAAEPRNGVGGLALLAGYVNNLRKARAADEGALLLIDSGDTFGGEVESDLSEGALMVDAYNAMGYTAEAIGNHDFDFGAVDSTDGRQTAGDLRGAVKARAAQAHYPFLAANLIEAATGRPVEWPNVRPSVIVDAAGLKVGVIGVITIDALNSTLTANVQGLRVAPLAPTIIEEATKLRAAGADLVLVAAHAGGRCARFDDPLDLSSCDTEGEIFRLARSLPYGLVDVIAAGHTHAGIAHEVNGIGIIEPLVSGQAFGRVDVIFNRTTRSVSEHRIFAPHPVVPGEPGEPLEYEGRGVAPDPDVVRAMQPALARVHQLQATALGVSLPAPIVRGDDAGSPLGNVFADAMRNAVPSADVAVVNTATRGLFADLPAGPLTFGRVYAAFPFDNRIARVTLTAAELGRWLEGEIRQGRRSGLGISGVGVLASCASDGVHVELFRYGNGIPNPIKAEERLLVATIGGPTLSGTAGAIDPLGGGGPAENAPIVRDALEDWLRQPNHMAQNVDAIHGAMDTRGCAF
jgi:2',3'-cyclic-nucleotide 2'-phosphodiesterase (5'-nucleotidase family)